VLLDSSGAPYNLRTGTAAAPVTAPVTLLFFGYSNCPDVCTGIIADVATARNRMVADLRGKVRIVVVTTDPARDTAPVLKAYLDRIDPNLVGLTGDLATIMKVAESVGVSIDDAQKLPSGGYEVVHGTQVIGFGKDLRAAVVWTYPTTVGDFRTDFETLARS
jgi:protein SCO1/2